MHYTSLLTMVFYGFVVAHTLAGEKTCIHCNKYYKPCFDKLCCCVDNLTYCKGHGSDLPYIPKLRDGIRSLDFENNFLPVLSREVFANISTLEITHLYIKADKVVNITEDAFKDIVHLTTLELSSNEKINKAQLSLSFGSLPNLKVLNLQNIALGHNIPFDYFKRLHNASVINLVLDINTLEVVNMMTFKYLPRLQYLSLANNRIKKFDGKLGHPCLNTLILTRNEIRRYPPFLCPTNHSVFPVLKNLYINQNEIRKMYRPAWKCLDSLERLVIGGNSISLIPKHVILDLTSLTELRVNGMLGVQESSLRISKQAFRSRSLRRLVISSNNIIFTKKHLENNIFEHCMGLTDLDVSSNNLAELEDVEIARLFSPLTQLQNLSMVSTHLRSIPQNLLTNFTDLAFLNVDDNVIQDVGDAFHGLTKLSYLSIKGNIIRVLKPQSFPENIRKTLTELNLADNFLDCSCENLWFRTWIGDQGKPTGTNISLIIWPWRYKCHSPSAWNGRIFKTFRPTEASCRTNQLLVSICVTLGSVGFIVIVSVPVCVRYNWHIQYMIYKLTKKKERDPERRALLGETCYHMEPYTYVIYHDDDSRFVHHDICDLIEKEFGLKLYIWLGMRHSALRQTSCLMLFTRARMY